MQSISPLATQSRPDIPPAGHQLQRRRIVNIRIVVTVAIAPIPWPYKNTIQICVSYVKVLRRQPVMLQQIT